MKCSLFSPILIKCRQDWGLSSKKLHFIQSWWTVVYRGPDQMAYLQFLWLLVDLTVMSLKCHKVKYFTSCSTGGAKEPRSMLSSFSEMMFVYVVKVWSQAARLVNPLAVIININYGAHCNTLTLSHSHTVTPSYCHTLTLLHTVTQVARPCLAIRHYSIWSRRSQPSLLPIPTHGEHV